MVEWVIWQSEKQWISPWILQSTFLIGSSSFSPFCLSLFSFVFMYIIFLFAFCSYCQAVETLHTVSPVWKIEESNYYFSLFVDYLYKGTLNFPSLSLPVFYFPPTFTYILKCHSDSFFYLLPRGNCSICFLFISNNMLPVLFLLFISFEGTGKHISSI